jgi:thiamine biosynthesis lipoprotein
MKSSVRLLSTLVLIICGPLFILACSQKIETEIVKIAGPTMGTEYHISWVSLKKDQAALVDEKQRIQQQVDRLLLDINKGMSTYDPQSELSLINHNFNSQWQDISADLYRVLMMAKQVNIQSNKAFDVTVGPLVNLWGFGPDKTNDKVPDKEEINALRDQLGSEVLNLRQRDEGFQLKLDAPRYLDLSAIAKGYAVDKLGRLLRRQGIENYLVEVGGEIVAHGTKPELNPWRIAIEAPNDDGRSVQIIVPLMQMGIATSGDYRNFFEFDGQRYSHTIDGRTGYPVKHKLASVSVLHEFVALADAWATALTVLGAEEGLKLAEEYNLAAYFIVRTDAGFEQYSSSQFEQLRLD